VVGECYRRYHQIELEYGVGRIDYVDLSESSERDQFTYNGTEDQKQKVTEFFFQQILKIDYIPVEIFTEFPNLNEIKIEDSKIPILKENLFGDECEKIKILWLRSNGIKIIERKAFYHLKNLVVINLSRNKIERITENIFQTNSKLEFVYFQENQIKALNPAIFRHLNHLKAVGFRSNRCASQDFGGYYPINLERMNNKLTPCYDNCIEDQECSVN
jgi:Leucine-rich repeat (LRR) protein